jgi:hypothetical protein
MTDDIDAATLTEVYFADKVQFLGDGPTEDPADIAAARELLGLPEPVRPYGGRSTNWEAYGRRADVPCEKCGMTGEHNPEVVH